MPNLYLDGLFAVIGQKILEEHKITHIPTMGAYIESKFPEKFEYKVWEMWNDEQADIKKFFFESIEFIETTLNFNGCVFVHWAAGVSKSASMVIT